jgi:tetratricopeptide (TPR) repeat protein
LAGRTPSSATTVGALGYCEQSIALHRELSDDLSQARALDSLGYAHHHLGHHRRAIACYERALALNRDHGDRHGEVHALDQLGDVYQADGQPAAALLAWKQALDVLGRLGEPGASQILAKIRDLSEIKPEPAGPGAQTRPDISGGRHARVHEDSP